jgi:hypothetical protein
MDEFVGDGVEDIFGNLCVHENEALIKCPFI